MKYVLNLEPETNRVLSVAYMPRHPADAIMVDSFPDGNVYEYLYINGEYIYDPLPEPDPVEPVPTQEERIAALETEKTELKQQVVALSAALLNL